jgi:hypothetical protein
MSTEEPVYGSITEDMYSRLPDHFRRMDTLNDWSLKKYIHVIANEQQQVDDLIERIDFDPIDAGGRPGDTSELVNPTKADPRWLPWLSQLFGVRLAGTGKEEDRTEVVQASSGFNAGTPAAIESAAKSALVGSKYSRVYKRSTNTIGAGGPWDLLLVTRADETLIQLYPEIQATLAETLTWNISATNGNNVSRKLVQVDPGLMLFRNNAMQISRLAGVGTTPYSIAVNSTYKVPVVATDWYQSFLTIWTDDHGAAFSGTFGIKYYDSGGTVLDTFSTALTVDETPTQVNYGETAPASTTHMTTFFTLDNLVTDMTVNIAQLGARHEESLDWLPRTADPIQTVIDKGAKPAGFKLWHNTLAADWNTFESNYPTWDDIEAVDWRTIEDS